jgi:hypothetical protein
MLILIEFILPFVVIAALLLWLMLRQRRKHADALKALLAAVKEQEGAYTSRLQEFLLSKAGLEKDGLDEGAKPFIQGRRKYYKQLLEALVSLEPALMPMAETTLQKWLNHYHDLALAQVPEDEKPEDVEAPSEELEVTKAENQVLKKENKRLKAEIHVSMSALNSLFREFSSMFGEVSPESNHMTVTEILEAMEKLTKGTFKPEGITGDIPPELEASDEPVVESSEEAPQQDDEPMTEADDVDGGPPDAQASPDAAEDEPVSDAAEETTSQEHDVQTTAQEDADKNAESESADDVDGAEAPAKDRDDPEPADDGQEDDNNKQSGP